MSQRIFHITLAKCGSQWVRDVLSSQDIWPDFDVRPISDGLEFPITPNSVSQGHNFFSPVHMYPPRWNAVRKTGDRAVIVIRDPRDRLVSLLFANLYSHEKSVKVNAWKSILLSLGSIGEDLKLLILTEAMLPFYESWCVNTPPECMVVRYGDLVEDPHGTFRRMAGWYGLAYSEQALDASIDRHSFERVSGRSRGQEDKHSHLRRGVRGDWRNYFDRALGQLWEQLYPGALRQIGFEASDSWWESLPEMAKGAEASRHSAYLDRIQALETERKMLEQECVAKERVITDLAAECQQRLALIEQLSDAIENSTASAVALSSDSSRPVAATDASNGMIG